MAHTQGNDLPDPALSQKRGIALIAKKADAIDPKTNTLRFMDKSTHTCDSLLITTGPRPAFDLIEGVDPVHGYTRSACTVDHAQTARENPEDSLIFFNLPPATWPDRCAKLIFAERGVSRIKTVGPLHDQDSGRFFLTSPTRRW